MKQFLSTSLIALSIAFATPKAGLANDVVFFDRPPTAEDILQQLGLGAPATPAAAIGPSTSRQTGFVGKDRSIVLPGSGQRLDQPYVPRTTDTQSYKTASVSPQPELLGDKWFAELVQFTKNDHNVRSSQMGVIVRIAEVMRKEPSLRLIISGHADSSGNDRINRPLSERRADAVRAMLSRDHGIATTRMQIRGASDDEPLAGMGAYDPRNRRVQFGFQQ